MSKAWDKVVLIKHCMVFVLIFFGQACSPHIAGFVDDGVTQKETAHSSVILAREVVGAHWHNNQLYIRARLHVLDRLYPVDIYSQSERIDRLSDQQLIVLYSISNQQWPTSTIQQPIYVWETHEQIEGAMDIMQIDELQKHWQQSMAIEPPLWVLVHHVSVASDASQWMLWQTESQQIYPITWQSKAHVSHLALAVEGWRSLERMRLGEQILGVITRPVTSALRLVNWGKSIFVDLLIPSEIVLLDQSLPPPLNDQPPMDLVAWEGVLDQSVSRAVYQGHLRLFVDGSEFFPILESRLTQVEQSIDVRIFIFDNDDVAVGLAKQMYDRKIAGAKVRVLLDSMGVMMGEGKMPEQLPTGFKPPASMVSYLSSTLGLDVRVRPNTFFRADHIKTICLDEKYCFTGGMNIGREYRYDWHDIMVELSGPVVQAIGADFERAWAYAGPFGDVGLLTATAKKKDVPYDLKNTIPIRLLYTTINDPQIFNAQLRAIEETQQRIYIHNPYFSDNRILHALIRARRRGVDVRVILPIHGNHGIMNSSNVITANVMFKHGIRVYFYPGMSHVKAALYDGWLCFGTANFDRLSLKDNLEMNLGLSDPSIVQEFEERVFYYDMDRSKEMVEPLQAGWQEFLAEIVANQL